ncbi:hypothetical protein N431DRAFT_325846 [Stipitochalara longipes BDJ]|nr:hypothetical protein N431DRAFT_325846 [Stipitochalara longipes BDJ]
MEKCTVRDIEITKTEIRNCILHYVFIQTSKVFNSKLYNCKVSNSTIEGSEVVDTGLHESDFIKSKLIGCKITTSLLSFCKFVPEIRAMIFKLCLSFEKNKTPALLIALRGDIFLYQQAIRLFYKLNCFTLNYYMLDRCSLMSVNAISNISKLTIE